VDTASTFEIPVANSPLDFPYAAPKPDILAKASTTGVVVVKTSSSDKGSNFGRSPGTTVDAFSVHLVRSIAASEFFAPFRVGRVNTDEVDAERAKIRG
jgi:hypothetical protein